MIRSAPAYRGPETFPPMPLHYDGLIDFANTVADRGAGATAISGTPVELTARLRGLAETPEQQAEIDCLCARFCQDQGDIPLAIGHLDNALAWLGDSLSEPIQDQQKYNALRDNVFNIFGSRAQLQLVVSRSSPKQEREIALKASLEDRNAQLAIAKIMGRTDLEDEVNKHISALNPEFDALLRMSDAPKRSILRAIGFRPLKVD